MNKKVVTSHKLHGLDHLRALAIMLVFLFHYQIHMFGHPEWLPDYAKFGWTGVDLFFVLSGFLISSQLFAGVQRGDGVQLKPFFIKRFFRILPLYWSVVAIYYYVPAFHEREHLPPLWKLLTFTQNFGLNLRTQGTFSHAWSLCVEEHFYLLLPLLVALLLHLHLFKKGYLLLPLLFAAGLLIRYYGWTRFYETALDTPDAGLNWYKYIYYPTYNRLDGLLTGVAIAAMYTFAPTVWNRIALYGNLLIIFGVLILTGAYYLCYDEQSCYASVFGFPVVALGYGMLVMGAISPSCFLYKWQSRITSFIAMLSYGIYLTHKGVIHITQNVLYNIDANSNTMMLICIVTCILAAWLAYIVIETPFMKLRNIVLASKASS